MSEQTTGLTENVADNEKEVNVRKPIDRKKLLLRIGCVILAIIAVSLSMYFIFREKYGIEPEIRVSFAGGEWKKIEDPSYGSNAYAWHIPYDGKEHTPTVTFWDGNTKISYKKFIYDEGCYGIAFSNDGGAYRLSCIKEKGIYDLKIESGPMYKNGKLKYTAQCVNFDVIIY